MLKITPPSVATWLPGARRWPALPMPKKLSVLPAAPTKLPVCSPQLPRPIACPAPTWIVPWLSNLTPLTVPLPCKVPVLMTVGN